jgi:NTP pyrophosphatase (non-canonical NTP hydrolase)
MARRGGPAQRRVRETMVAAGGYWRPLAAVARLLEELGELAELHHERHAELPGELADLWIITTALADQFLGEVEEPSDAAFAQGGERSAGAVARGGERSAGAFARGGERSAADGRTPGSIEALFVAAGPIARVINHYDGPKVPRPSVPLPSLNDAVAGFQATLGSLAAELGVNLAAAVGGKLEEIHRRGDIERFGRGGFDPSTAAVLSRFTAGSAPDLRLWGAPDPVAGASPEDRAAALLPSLRTFAKAAGAERIEGYAIEGPHAPGAAGRAAWVGALVAAIDPAGSSRRFELDGIALSATLAPPAPAGRTLALVAPGC